MIDRIRHALGGSLSVAHGLWLAAVLLRLPGLLRLTSSASLMPDSGDMLFYDQWAHRILQGEWTDGRAFYGLPGYPWLLAGIYSLLGTNPALPAFLQICLDSCTAVLIYLICVNVLTREQPHALRRAQLTGALAALTWVFFVPAQAYALSLMPTAWLTFGLWFVVWQLTRPDFSPKPRLYFACGLLIGAVATAVATILFQLPLLVVAAFLKNATPDAARHRVFAMRAVAALLLGVAAGTAPVWLHNTLVARDPVFLSAHSGVNFWIGNHPQATGYPSFPGLRTAQSAMLQDSIEIAEHDAGRPLRRSEVSRFWSERTWRSIRSEPLNWLRIISLKLRNFWSAFQYDDLSVITRFREQDLLLPGPSFGLVAALAIPGMFVAAVWLPRSRWMLGAVALHMCAVLSVFVTERYRLAAVPGLIVLASFGLLWLWDRCRSARWLPAAAYLIAAGAGALAVSQPTGSTAIWALEAYSAGLRALENGDLDTAGQRFEQALRYAPGNAEARFALGNVFLARKDFARTKETYEEVLAVDPLHKGALNNLGVLALEFGFYPVAEDYFRQVEALEHGRNARTFYLRAKALLGMGRRDAARAALDQALQLAPDQPEFVALRQEL